MPSLRLCFLAFPRCLRRAGLPSLSFISSDSIHFLFTMSLPKHAPSSSASSVYTSHPASLVNEYIHIASTPFKGDNKSEMFTEDESVHSRPSLTYLPPPFPPPGYDPSSNAPQPFRQKHRRAIAVARYIFVLILITAGFTAPVVYFTLSKPEETDGVKDLRLPICTWLLASWGFTCVSNILINIFPYAFRLVARWVNPGQVKYWRIFRYMRLAVTLLGGAVGTYCSFVYVSYLLLLHAIFLNVLDHK